MAIWAARHGLGFSAVPPYRERNSHSKCLGSCPKLRGGTGTSGDQRALARSFFGSKTGGGKIRGAESSGEAPARRPGQTRPVGRIIDEDLAPPWLGRCSENGLDDKGWTGAGTARPGGGGGAQNSAGTSRRALAGNPPRSSGKRALTGGPPCRTGPDSSAKGACSSVVQGEQHETARQTRVWGQPSARKTGTKGLLIKMLGQYCLVRGGARRFLLLGSADGWFQAPSVRIGRAAGPGAAMTGDPLKDRDHPGKQTWGGDARAYAPRRWAEDRGVLLWFAAGADPAT